VGPQEKPGGRRRTERRQLGPGANKTLGDAETGKRIASASAGRVQPYDANSAPRPDPLD